MGKKGKKTRWRRLPIGGTDEEGGLSLEPAPPTTDPHRITFNEDEYTKITTPRQDVLFKKGYFGRKRTPNPSPSDTQEVHSGDSVEGESYVSEEPQYVYPTGYMDPNGVYYVNGNTFETYDPYTGTVTVVVGPPAQYPGGAPVLAALPCQPVPLQPVEWFNPPAPWCYSYNRRKRYSTDSQNCSAQSSESTGPPGSPQEPVDEGACAMYPPQYIYPGYMFGPPIYNMNGVTVQGMIPQPVSLPPDLSASKRRKKRRRRRRGGVTDDGSESSCCEEPLSYDVVGCQSGTSSDAGGSKANSDSGINTDPTPNSGSNSPPLHTLAQVTESVNNIQFECHQHQEIQECHQHQEVQECHQHQEVQECHQHQEIQGCHQHQEVQECHQHQGVQSSGNCSDGEDRLVVSGVSQETHLLPLYSNHESAEECVTASEVTTPEEISEELSATEDDVTPNLCAAAPEFSSQESTLSCISTASVTKELLLNEHEISYIDTSQEEIFESCQSLTETASVEAGVTCKVTSYDDFNCESILIRSNTENSSDDLKSICEESNNDSEGLTMNTEYIHLNGEKDLLNNSNGESTSDQNLEIKTITDEPEEVHSYIIDKMDDLCKNEEEEKESRQEEEENMKLVEHEPIATTSTEIDASKISETDSLDSRFVTYKDTITPVPPPRRKRSSCRAADKLASRIVEEAIKEGIQEAACSRLRSPMPITEAVTRWLNSQGSSPLTCPASDSGSDQESDDDEGIEVGEGSTNPKNVRGNPFPVPSRSGSGQRVARDCESVESSAGEWDLWDHSHTREMCDPTRSVDKYYRLGGDDGVGDKVPPSVYKTAMHIRHTGPFPCGVCCIIQ